ncbi:hypothetical protein TeGR_g15003 [Tetraparma gracilis]|uniref:Vesicle transport protein n=1 Tax=Tetraparma gracilis TaxID=2962635 RepID=A0ABQ6NC28_9STRA|nr:hypothetical protein TeGR_g15003 [Tetraparma gracilis]
MLSFANFAALVSGNPLPFVLMYSLGNLLALCSSMFLVGPARQWRQMTDKSRRYTSLVYVVCLVTTFVFVFVPGIDWGARLIVLLVCVICQFLAAVWYTLSYIPYGRATVLRYSKQCCCMEDV